MYNVSVQFFSVFAFGYKEVSIIIISSISKALISKTLLLFATSIYIICYLPISYQRTLKLPCVVQQLTHLVSNFSTSWITDGTFITVNFSPYVKSICFSVIIINTYNKIGNCLLLIRGKYIRKIITGGFMNAIGPKTMFFRICIRLSLCLCPLISEMA